MKNVRHIAIFLAMLLMLAGLCGCAEKDITVFDDGELSVTPDPSKYVNIAIDGKGMCIFDPPQNPEYRYGPTLLTNSDGSIDAWFAGPGHNGQWDWIYYRRSGDGGKTWSQEKVALMGTSGSRDGNSVCDPGVIKIGKYYYLGYTSTLYQETGNCVFVARSENPEGPYYKWDGEGWSGTPEPIVYFDENTDYFGAGEPSFVEKDGTLYIYINWMTGGSQFTRVYTADATSENWPATMEYKGNAIEERAGDSLDVKFVDDFGKFLGVCAADRMTADSKLVFYQSDDGINFQLCSEISEGTAAGAHNCGISGRPNGHIRLSDDIYVGYAYGAGEDNWAHWPTRLQKVNLSLADSSQSLTSVKAAVFEDEDSYSAGSSDYIAGVYANDLRMTVADGSRKLSVLAVDGKYTPVSLSDRQGKDLKFTVWDEAIAKIDEKTLEVTALKAGFTHITVQYEHFSYTCALYVYENEDAANDKSILRVEPSQTSAYIISLSYGYPKQIKAMVYYADGSFEEISKLRFNVSDPSVCAVDSSGFIRVKGIGTTEVTVKYKGEEVFSVNVTVTE